MSAPFEEAHLECKAGIADFIERRVVPEYDDWERAGGVPRSLYRELGELGVMGISIPEEFGGGGTDDYLFNVVIQQAAAEAAVTLGTLRTHLDIVLPYFLSLCTAEQKARWFPGLASGDLFSAIALSEPETGSDLAGVRTQAKAVEGGFVLNGAKTFITGGMHADLVIVLARTDVVEGDRRAGLSLFVVEASMDGFVKERKLDKIGLGTQDCSWSLVGAQRSSMVHK